ncbi:hypothetical protein ACFQPF_05320 [Fictibacillus iocasae]|uniref:DUF4367 domain-containing protein n=1 Tax=Fictibacillus iocasae TaxID=2715437 RepID=A0ABW2NKU3_9BACL
MKKRKWSIGFILFAILSILVLNVPLIHYPVWVPKKFEYKDYHATYIPFKVTDQYATIVTCGRNCSQVHYHYKNDDKHLSVLATDKASWSSDAIWQRKNRVPGTNYYYNSTQLAWIEEDTEVEVFIKLEGQKSDVKTLLNVAESIK